MTFSRFYGTQYDYAHVTFSGMLFCNFLANGTDENLFTPFGQKKNKKTKTPISSFETCPENNFFSLIPTKYKYCKNHSTK